MYITEEHGAWERRKEPCISMSGLHYRWNARFGRLTIIAVCNDKDVVRRSVSKLSKPVTIAEMRISAQRPGTQAESCGTMLVYRFIRVEERERGDLKS
jgi:hypothetical protein